MKSRQMVTFTALLLALGAGASQTMSFNFDGDPVDKPPAGFTSYATGGGPPGKWVVKEMADARSGNHVLVQTDADATDTRFLDSRQREYGDLDVSVKGKALSGKIDQGIGLVFRFRDPKSYYVVRPMRWRTTSGFTGW